MGKIDLILRTHAATSGDLRHHCLGRTGHCLCPAYQLKPELGFHLPKRAEVFNEGPPRPFTLKLLNSRLHGFCFLADVRLVPSRLLWGAPLPARSPTAARALHGGAQGSVPHPLGGLGGRRGILRPGRRSCPPDCFLQVPGCLRPGQGRSDFPARLRALEKGNIDAREPPGG